MATKKTKQITIDKAATKVLGMATKVNDCALNTAERYFDFSLKVANKSLDMTSKVIKKGLDISSSQQDLVFDAIEGAKKRVIKK